MPSHRPLSVLFYIEPVIFRRAPLQFAPHVEWCAWIMGNNPGLGLSWHVATSPFLIERLAALVPDLHVSGRYGWTALDPRTLTAEFDFDRHAYARSLYGSGKTAGALEDSLRELKRRLAPEVVVATTQNAAITSVFDESLTLFLEQAPLPRRGRRTLRMGLDPHGHQVGSLIERRRADILSFVDREADAVAILDLWNRATEGTPEDAEARRRFCAALDGRSAAILALQPPDAPSYEGAGVSLAPEDLLMSWLAALPDGMVGTPTFHADHSVPPELIAALGSMFPNLVAVPEGRAPFASETLAPAAAGLVTATSTAAAFAAIAGTKVAIVAKSPFGWLSDGGVAGLAEAKPLTILERASMLAFLCCRYAHRYDELFQTKDYFENLVRTALSLNDPVDYWLDRGGVSMKRIERLLSLD